MGLFDFLKPQTPNSAEPPVPAAKSPRALKDEINRLNPEPLKLNDEQSNWHYEFAHMALRIPAFLQPDFAFNALGDPDMAINLIGAAVKRAGANVGLSIDQCVILASRIDVYPRRFGVREGFVVAMPRPQRKTECHFIALVRDGDASLRYFTLERSGRDATMLCGWNAEGGHLNFGDGPAPTLEAFVAAAASQL